MARAEVPIAAYGAKRVRAFVTPEGVDLRLVVADASERASAFLLDALMVAGLLVVFTILALLGAWGAGFERPGGELILSVWLIVFFVARYGWFVWWELRPRAATPGKRVTGIRVAARDGGRLTADAVFVRNAMRELEVFLPLTLLLAPGSGIDGVTNLVALIWMGVFVLFPLFNRDRLRVGDLIAGTWVVRSPRRRLAPDLAERAPPGAASPYVFTLEQAAAYGEYELHVLEEVLRSPDPRTHKAVASRIRGKIRWDRVPGETDRAFLDAYYTTLRGRLEGGLVLGRRKKNKFDAGA